MTKDQKIIRAKAGLLELAKPLGNVSQACKIMGYSRDVTQRLYAASVGVGILRAACTRVHSSPSFSTSAANAAKPCDVFRKSTGRVSQQHANTLWSRNHAALGATVFSANGHRRAMQAAFPRR